MRHFLLVLVGVIACGSVNLIQAQELPTQPASNSDQRLKKLSDDVEAARKKLKRARRALQAAMKEATPAQTEQALLPYAQRFMAHRYISQMAVSPLGDHVATSGEDSLGIVWNLHTGQHVAKLEMTPGRPANCLQYTPDGKWLLAASAKTVRVISTSNFKVDRELEAGDVVNCITFSEDGKRMLISAGTAVELWTLPTWTRVETFETRMQFVRSVRFTRDGNGAIACGGFYNNAKPDNDHTVVAWDWTSKAIRYRFAATRQTPTYLAMELSNGELLTYGGAHAIECWDLKSLEKLSSIRSPTPVPVVLLMPDEKHAILASGTGTDIRFLSLTQRTTVHTLAMRNGNAMQLALTPDQRHMVIGTQSGWIEVLAVPDEFVPAKFREQPARPQPRDVIPPPQEVPLARILEGHSGTVSAVAFLPGTNRLLSGGADRKLVFWNPATGKSLNEFAFEAGEVINALALSEDGRLAIACGSGERGRLLTFDLDRWSPERELQGHAGPVLGVSWTHDGRILSCGSDKTVRVFNGQTGEETLKIEGLDSSAQKVAMAPDGETIIALCRENLVFCDPRSGKTAMRVLATGHCLAYQPGFPHNVLFAQPTNLHLSRTPKMAIGKVHDFPLKSPQYGAFSPDGKSIVVSFGAQINPVLLDATTPLERCQFSGASTAINSMAVSHNGLVAGAGSDNRIYLWTVPKMP